MQQAPAGVVSHHVRVPMRADTSAPSDPATACAPRAGAAGAASSSNGSLRLVRSRPARHATASAGAEDQPAGSRHPAAVRFLRACARKGPAAALAALVRAGLLPLPPPEARDMHTTEGALLPTLAYMYALASRGGLLQDSQPGDTAVRALLWTTESFHSQYRTSGRQAAFDYSFTCTGERQASCLSCCTCEHAADAGHAWEQRAVLASLSCTPLGPCTQSWPGPTQETHPHT
jgi:hypothetical protein